MSNNNKPKIRKRNYIHFIPSYCQTVQTNIVKLFLNLMDKKKTHEFYKILNRN